MLVWKWKQKERLVLKDKRRNRLAEAYLTSFGHNVDRVREKHRRIGRIAPGERFFADYLFTVQRATDDLTTRKQREQILEKVFDGIFKAEDPFRGFNQEQRRIIWAASKGKCARCRKKLRFSSFHVDHVFPHSRGGPTTLENAALLCPRCNAKKGDRT